MESDQPTIDFKQLRDVLKNASPVQEPLEVGQTAQDLSKVIKRCDACARHAGSVIFRRDFGALLCMTCWYAIRDHGLLPHKVHLAPGELARDRRLTSQRAFAKLAGWSQPRQSDIETNGVMHILTAIRCAEVLKALQAPSSHLFELQKLRTRWPELAVPVAPEVPELVEPLSSEQKIAVDGFLAQAKRDIESPPGIEFA